MSFTPSKNDHTTDPVYKVASDYNARVFFEGFGEFERRLQVTPTTAGWHYLSFRVYAFRRGQVLDGESASDEMVMVLLSGQMTLEAGGQKWQLDGRRTMFEGAPHLLYLPPGFTYHLNMHADCEVAYSRAPAEGKLQPRLILPSEIRTESRAEEIGAYRVNYLLDQGDAEKLLCTETVMKGPGWMPYPPLKHDTDNLPHEAYLEAVRYYRFDPATAWGMQRLYSSDHTLDETFSVCDGDAVIVRSGYQTFATPPCANTYCLNFLAGPVARWALRRDAQDIAE